jgi:hypothetical protein
MATMVGRKMSHALGTYGLMYSRKILIINSIWKKSDYDVAYPQDEFLFTIHHKASRQLDQKSRIFSKH